MASLNEIARALQCSNSRCRCHRPTRQGWTVHCVAHRPDKNPSLSLTEKGGRLLWFCHAGCDQKAVARALRERGLLTDAVSKPKLDRRQLKRAVLWRRAVCEWLEQWSDVYKTKILLHLAGDKLALSELKAGLRFIKDAYRTQRWLESLDAESLIEVYEAISEKSPSIISRHGILHDE